MPIATHIIKIVGTFNEDWTEEKLKKFVKEKILTEIDGAWHPDLELFRIDKPNTVNIWIYIQEAAIGLVGKKIVERWIKHHVKEKGLLIKKIDIEKIPYEDGFIVELNDVSLKTLTK